MGALLNSKAPNVSLTCVQLVEVAYLYQLAAFIKDDDLVGERKVSCCFSSQRDGTNIRLEKQDEEANQSVWQRQLSCYAVSADQ